MRTPKETMKTRGGTRAFTEKAKRKAKKLPVKIRIVTKFEATRKKKLSQPSHKFFFKKNLNIDTSLKFLTEGTEFTESFLFLTKGFSLCSPYLCEEQLEQSADVAVVVNVDVEGGRHFWQAWHGHDFTGKGDNKARPGIELDIANREDVIFWRAHELWIVAD